MLTILVSSVSKRCYAALLDGRGRVLASCRAPLALLHPVMHFHKFAKQQVLYHFSF